MIILDTNVLSELMKPEQDKEVMRWINDQLATTLFTTTVSQSEILFGLHLLPEGRHRSGLLLATEQMFQIDFSGRVLPFDSIAAQMFAQIASEARLKGRVMSSFDAQIAAIVKSQRAILATRNMDDFQTCQIKLINPWEKSK